MRVTGFESTPNPNAIKCLVEPGPSPAPRSYFKREDAVGDPLAEALFAIDGVTNVLIHQTFITVNKSAESVWSSIKSAVERAVADA